MSKEISALVLASIPVTSVFGIEGFLLSDNAEQLAASPLRQALKDVAIAKLVFLGLMILSGALVWNQSKKSSDDKDAKDSKASSQKIGTISLAAILSSGMGTLVFLSIVLVALIIARE